MISTNPARPDHPYKHRVPNINPMLPVINWGSWAFPTAISHHRAPILNNPNRVCVSKYHALQILASKGVSVPRHWLANDPTMPPEVRKVPRLFNHRGGTDIELCTSGEATPDYYTEFIEGTQEYRIHVANWMHDEDSIPQVLLAQRKYEPDGHDERWPRNHRNGYCFRTFQPYSGGSPLFQQPITAVRALGLDFGAVDVIKSSYDGSYYVLEVNTAPGLTIALPQYVDALSQWSPIRCPA